MANNFKQNLILEFKKISMLSTLIPQKDWDLIWVLTAREIDIKNSKGQKNETKDRLETGIKLVKEITKLRIGNQELTLNSLQQHGPKIYYSGYNDHNEIMKKYKNSKYF